MKHLFAIFFLLSFVKVYGQKADTSQIYFELNISRVSTLASITLDSLWYKKVIAPGKKTILLGFGDYLGSDGYNLALSQRRAQNVKDYLVALGLDEKDIVLCEGKGRIIRKPIPGELGFYRDRKVEIITEQVARKAPEPVVKKAKPAPKKPASKPAIVKKEPATKPEPVKKVAKVSPPPPPPAPKPAVTKVEQPKPAQSTQTPPMLKTAVPVAAATPAPPLNRNVEVKRKPEKTLATLDPSKLQVNEIIPLNNVYFAPGSNAMLRKSEPALNELYKFLTDNPDISIEIQGHICCLDPADGTDEPDGLGGNRSEGRAKNIYIYLASKGIDRNRMRFVGLGNKKPAVYPERTEFDRELNRRATIMVTGK